MIRLFRYLYRRLGYGHFARVLYALCTAIALLMLIIGINGLEYGWDNNRPFFLWLAGLWGGTLGLIYFLMSGFEYIAESDFVRKSFLHGTGGSARWAGAGTFSKYEYKTPAKAPIYFGKTLGKYDVKLGGREIVIDDENHLITIAQSGAGKSTTVIWPNLVKHCYPDSVFILDPKGEHARYTADHRAAKGQRVVILDPFGLSGKPSQGFNPLAHIDPDSPRAAEDIKAIADACVIPPSSQSDTGDHFDSLKRAMICGVIAHTLSTEPKHHHNLPFVYDRLMELSDADGFARFVEGMRNNSACGDLPRRAVTMYEMAGKNEKGSIFTSTITCFEWVASEGMRTLLLGQGLELSQLRTQQMSLYVVLDFEAMKPEFQGRFMRVVLNLAFEACRHTPLPASRSNRRTLFILDEVAQVGAMPSIQSAYQTLRGSNVKIWSFYQQYSGLTGQVADTAAVTGNSTKQFFGCNDPITAEQIEKYLGQYKYRDQTREIQRSLLDQTEILDTLGQTSMVQIVITGQGDKMELTRERYIPSKASPGRDDVKKARRAVPM